MGELSLFLSERLGKPLHGLQPNELGNFRKYYGSLAGPARETSRDFRNAINVYKGTRDPNRWYVDPSPFKPGGARYTAPAGTATGAAAPPGQSASAVLPSMSSTPVEQEFSSTVSPIFNRQQYYQSNPLNRFLDFLKGIA